MVARLAACLGLLLALGACTSKASAPDAGQTAGTNAYLAVKSRQSRSYRPFPQALPDEPEPAVRRTSAVTSFDGVERLMDSGVGVSVNSTNNWWLVLDGTATTRPVWAIWRFPECTDPPNGQFQQFVISANVGATYYIAYADYSVQRWRFYKIDAYPDGVSSTFSIEPSEVPGGESVLHSPAGFAYIAVVNASGQPIQIKYVSAETPEPDPIPGTDSIPDAFENNDDLDICTPLAPGMYHASIHQSYAVMAMPGEERDPIDCYCVDVPAGKTLTATLRHEIWDHFGSGFENDADLLFYTNPGASSVYNDFDEPLSSTGIYYDPFEQVTWTNTSGSDMMVKLAVVGDLSEPGVRTNCEYDLSIFVSDSVFDVSGSITQNGATLNKDVVAFLEPGNFNITTPVPGSGSPGAFNIVGVPPGTYVLKVHGTARFGPQGHIWTETKPDIQVTVTNVTGLTLDIGSDP